ncbi:molybdopterin molybdotransferase MoeA [Maribacter hydrothermalis]|uniref:Molybdopterin molybdenumtransferase n=1 Tax=Maribacter hydrothermalis TaxID=1836467 RepID=A0A1B7ZDT0_9FLAO|nr:molybdopterin molybdotransferase MoeA [Maribacter hydrothermalis]APQ18430.1 molybdopterin molybdenumtransferase MoeA [Maribacter hydrothermalis]OBR41363.1 molybdopterin molybdenumtransferase MoeA [Maribacter hydrothermalis]
MITFKEAYQKVLAHPIDLGTENVSLLNSLNRILAEDIYADRDFPPFDRATKDGVAIQFSDFVNNGHSFKIEGVAAAGVIQQVLKDKNNCLEVMTGAVVPLHCDTVVMYEHITIEGGKVTINEKVNKGQNIHYQGSDEKVGALLLSKGKKISPAEIGVMATVGKVTVKIKGNPKICTIATGNELVEVNETPRPHQIRKSNMLTIESALLSSKIEASSLHLLDDKKEIERELEKALQDNDVLLLSGGVSKGKFDFIPEVMESLGVEKVFHRVLQRPGKPFWFGIHHKMKTVIFSFPGNPVSTFANYHLYFLAWLQTSWQLPLDNSYIKLSAAIKITQPLTRFIQVSTEVKEGMFWATPVVENGSGDLTSLAKADGFICLEPRNKEYEVGEAVPFVKTR